MTRKVALVTGAGMGLGRAAALLLAAVSVSGAIFLILEMSRPYGGVMQVSIVPIRDALLNMRK